MKVLIVLCIFTVANAGKEFCHLEPETGLCRGYFPRFYYDPEDGSCKKFVYGGCEGNENSFETEEECLQTCSEPESQYSVDSVAYCHMRPERGLCLAYMPRYYYNAKTRQCEKFIYGGCGGNSNNFATKEECENKCIQTEVEFTDVPVCEQPVKPGRCLAFMPRFYYDKTEGRCREFIYGGCGGNDNNFETMEECEQQCGALEYYESTCQQKPQTGPCRGYFPRYYYDEEKGECRQFVYGGCRGNDNNFQTVEDCETTCKIQQSRPKSDCYKEKEIRPCKIASRRFYYDQETGKCEAFPFGRCGANENHFNTLDECRGICEDCTSEPETGLCDALFYRYYYDQESQSCKEFVYGGCGGNGNNYRTKEECLQTCASSHW